jgi:Holliday junction resolvase RusA-like endonuclease
VKDFCITIPGTPLAQPRLRATVIGNKARVYQPAVARDSKATIMQLAMDFTAGSDQWPLTGPVAVRITAVFPCPKYKHRKRKPAEACFKSNGPDADNIAKHYLDALCASGIVCLDDRQVSTLQVLKLQAAQEAPPYTKVEIVPLC